jgi:hypothetical protein
MQTMSTLGDLSMTVVAYFQDLMMIVPGSGDIRTLWSQQDPFSR